MKRVLLLLLLAACGPATTTEPKAPAPDRSAMACSGDPVAKESGLSPTSDLAGDLEGLPIGKVEVMGFQRLSSETIERAMHLENGKPLSREAVASGIRALYAEGQIEDVQVFVTHAESGVTVTVMVRERPRVAEIFAPGIPERSKAEMAKWIGLEQGKPFDVAEVALQRRTIAENMSHRGAKLDVRTHVLSNGELDVCILVQQ